ncbi:MAG: PAS domain S-box protein [Deltaproteobacteria bacterium]|nr:PAS domain S-box protein [Deltaproteobacteria bacterium]NIS78356.1 PAS domain S-box protein [Deltaproteobacteria bacterium]
MKELSLHRKYLELGLIALVGLVLSTVLFLFARQAEDSRIALGFARSAEKQMAVLKRELAMNLHEVDDLRTYYESSELVTEAEFAVYTYPTTSHYQGITAEIWAPRVTGAERAPFERELRGKGTREAQVTERGGENRPVRAGTREEYYPVRYIEPRAGNELYVGFDLYSEPGLRAVLDRVRDTGSLLLTRHIPLGGDRESVSQYLVISPHYRKGVPLDTADERRGAHKGFLIGLLDISQVAANAISSREAEPVRLFLFDGPATPGKTPLFFSSMPKTGAVTGAPPSFEAAYAAGITFEETLPIANLNLQVVMFPQPGLIASKKTLLPPGILLAGILLTGLLCLYVRTIRGHNTRIRQFANNLLRTSNEVARERNRAQSFLNIAGVIIVALNREGEITLINKKGCEILGYGEGELIGQNWFQKCLPEATGKEVSAIFRKVLAGEIEIPVDIEYPVLTGSGEERIIAWSNSLLRDENGEVIAKLSSGEDVTERLRSTAALKESEKRFRDLVESAVTGILIAQDGQVVYRNPEVERLFGPIQAPIKLDELRGIHPEDAKRFLNMFERVRSGALHSVEEELRHSSRIAGEIRSDTRWIYCRASAIEYRGKRATLLNVMDITRSKELAMVVKDRITSLGRVAAGVAHEIRNPLSGINIYTKTLRALLERGENGGKAAEIISQIQAASNKIESVVRKALDFSRPGLTTFALTDLNAIVEEAVTLSSVSILRGDISIKKELAPDLPKCYADRRLFEQLILNLIANAAEAMRTTSIPRRIRITTSSENNTIILKVSDSGPGVSEDIRDRIFDPFFTTKSENTGLGLSISNRIIMDHGGLIDVARSEWGGAEFVLQIPVERRRTPR